MDTIAAIATAQLPSAIGIVRISGALTRSVIAALFTPFDHSDPMLLPCRRMVYGAVHDAQGTVLDHVLVVLFSAAHSYTGEESAEIHCHGSPVVLGEVLRAALRAGARQAEPGEYTKRAFLNGKMDLTEAEAVIDLIDAETAEAAHNAVLLLDGALRRPLERIYDALLNISSRFYAVVDYPDEDIEELTRDQLLHTLTETERELTALLSTFARGRVMKAGVATAIVGAPNAGKSSLLNALVGFDRAIVTELAGTTRDTVEEKAVVGGVLLRLIDTAGIRESDDVVEKLGIERSRRAMLDADLIFVLTDGTRPITPEDRAIAALAEESGKPRIFIQTKRDLAPPAAYEGIAADAAISLSCVTLEGMAELEQAVSALFPMPTSCGALLTNARQADAVERAAGSVHAAVDALHSGMTPDAVLTEIEQAQDAIGELTGRTARSDMVERIFERFCVGK